MSLDKATVKNIAFLSRMEIPDSEIDGVQGDLRRIINWVEQLQEVDTTGVTPMTSAVGRAAPLREDEVTDGAVREEVLSNAPESEDGFFLVPKMVE